MKRATMFLFLLLLPLTAAAYSYTGPIRFRHQLLITTTSLPNGTVGKAYSGRITAAGGSVPYTYSASGLPGGLKINNSTGAITGVPTQGTAGTATAAVTVKDSSSNGAQTATANLRITIQAGTVASTLSITTTSLPNATSGVAYNGSVAATGGTAPYTFSASGLPGGLSINSSSGAIAGTTTAIGMASVSVTVKDSTQPTAQSATSQLTITVASTTTTAAVCGNMSTGNLASLNGYVPFPSSSAWNTNITASPVDAKSATIIGALTGNHLHPDFSTPADGNYGIPYIVVDSNSTPGVAVDMNGYPDESDITLYPIPSNAPIEGAPPNCSSSGDDHLIVLDKTKCWLYETWSTQVCNGTWSASNGAVWDLTSNEQRPFGWTSSDAAGLSVFAGLVRYDEVAAGAINHALRVTVNNTKSDLNGGYFVAPATHAAGTNSGTSNIMGMRLRLKSSFNISGFSQTNQVILKAMQQYGLIVADNGSNMFFQGTPDARWNDDDLNNLKNVDASQFEVVQMPTAYDSATAPKGAAPSIASFNASQTSVSSGTPVTLTWSVSGDSYDFIDAVGTVRGGTQTVTPTKTTTYTLNSTNQFGRSTKSVTITVQ